jgi:hypothetical protein
LKSQKRFHRHNFNVKNYFALNFLSLKFFQILDESNVWEADDRGVDIDESFVQEVLEHAYPSPLSVEFIATTLKVSEIDILWFL